MILLVQFDLCGTGRPLVTDIDNSAFIVGDENSFRLSSTRGQTFFQFCFKFLVFH